MLPTPLSVFSLPVCGSLSLSFDLSLSLALSLSRSLSRSLSFYLTRALSYPRALSANFNNTVIADPAQP